MAFTTYVSTDAITPENLNTNFESICPIGGIIAWAKTITGVPALPGSFLECDGSAISDAESPMDGQNVPNLNGTPQMLIGATTSGGTGTNNHTHQQENASQSLPTSGASVTQALYDVVWVIRIK